MQTRISDLARLEPRRVCIIKPSSLGDVVHALPTLHALRDRWPQATFSWVINRSLRGLLEGHPEIDELILYDRARAGASIQGAQTVARLLGRLRQSRFDMAIDLQGLFRSGLMAAATLAPVRIGLARAREGATWFYTHGVQEPAEAGPLHAVDRLLRVAEALGANVVEPRAIVALQEADCEWARQTLASLPEPRIVLNPGARWLTKRWPPEHFAEVGRKALQAWSAGLVVVGAPEDRPLAEALIDRLGPAPVVDLCGRTSLPQLAAIARETDLFVSNDTGPLHLATAAGSRVVGIFTCTDPIRTGPYGDRAHVVASQIWCAASLCKSCDRLDCMDELSPDRVWRVVRRALEPVATLGTAPL